MSFLPEPKGDFNMRPILRWLIVISAICFPPLYANSATTYYVDIHNSVASDSNPGTQALPWQTISKASSIARGGDTVIVEPGRYEERGTLKTYSGTSTSHIVFQAAHNATVGGSTNTSMRGWWLQGVSYIDIVGFEITNIGTGNRSGIFLRGPDHIQIKNVYIHQLECDVNYPGGIDGDSNGSTEPSYIAVTNSTFYKCELVGISAVGNHWDVENNDLSRSRNARTDGTVVANDMDLMRILCDYSTFKGNYIHDNYMADATPWGSPPQYPCIDGIMAFSTGGYHANYDVVENNIFERTDQQLFTATDAYGPPSVHYVSHFIISNNLFLDCGFPVPGYMMNNVDVSYITLANNVFAITDSHYVGYPVRMYQSNKDGCHDLILENNIFYGFHGAFSLSIDTDSLVNSVIDYNLWDHTDPSVIQGQEAHSIFASDPLFVNAAAGNFHLTSGSPAIGHATNLYTIFTTDMDGNTRPSSSAWDIGPYEATVINPPSHLRIIRNSSSIERFTSLFPPTRGFTRGRAPHFHFPFNLLACYLQSSFAHRALTQKAHE
jgi:hypothetical protein